tara:strand:- start:28 stop:180 length:153 start_codon:yes stop_codon:yes gene_type:complete
MSSFFKFFISAEFDLKLLLFFKFLLGGDLLFLVPIFGAAAAFILILGNRF